ncbi:MULTISPECIES: hypothetical protein [Rhizobium]|uniref:Uncharacterized protein n=1 Tax=Rhizobium favelukesii TaxID=348824 RepID=W6RHB2_9HYPH|nr:MULTISPECIES: hypothetical protein [Rhizobium]MCS0463437.1 hypothetical protein [Rhizobium favelukesii]UFS84948.1 hypothetical protein LPB79_31250 [Rhizobium sp. T136]CDM60199.1 hypothetical protein LPU83_pLPU83b_0205 [Rhizobium favelukesii]
MLQSLAIIVTDACETKTAQQDRCQSAVGLLAGTSMLIHLLAQLAQAGVQKSVILTLHADLGLRLHSVPNGMDLCLRALPTPNAGRLIDAVTVDEISEVRGEVLIFTENLNIDVSLIKRLIQASGRNLIVVGKSHSQRSLRLLTNNALRVTAILPRSSVSSRNVTADLIPIGVYKFSSELLRSIARSRRRRRNDDLEFFEAALGRQAYEMHVMHGGTMARPG